MDCVGKKHKRFFDAARDCCHAVLHSMCWHINWYGWHGLVEAFAVARQASTSSTRTGEPMRSPNGKVPSQIERENRCAAREEIYSSAGWGGQGRLAQLSLSSGQHSLTRVRQIINPGSCAGAFAGLASASAALVLAPATAPAAPLPRQAPGSGCPSQSAQSHASAGAPPCCPAWPG